MLRGGSVCWLFTPRRGILFSKSGGIAIIYIEPSNLGCGGEPLGVMPECISLCGLSHPKGIEGKLCDGVMYGCESWIIKKAEC